MLVNFPARASDAKIVFDSGRGEHGSKIYVMNADGAVTGPIGSLPGGHADPKFSPDNRHIVFTYYAPGISGAQIYVMNADGSQPYALTSSPNTKRAPQFTQGSRIVYWQNPGSPSSPWVLYNMESDGSHQVPLSFNISGNIADVSIGNNGMAAFAGSFVKGDSHETAQIYVASINGTGLRRLTDSPDTFSSPGWSPDSRKLAYANQGTWSPVFSNIVAGHDQDGIHIMNADGSNAKRIARIDFSKEFGPPRSFPAGGRHVVYMCGSPSFSPDGGMLTYAVNLGEKCQIYLVNLDGSGLKRLTHPPSRSANPSFSH